MFESVNDLAKRLPHPEWTGDPINDRRAIEQHIANGKRLRSEAVISLWRVVAASFRGRVPSITKPIGATPSPQV